MPTRVLLTDRPWPDAVIERQVLEAAGIELVEATASDESTLAAAANDCSAIMTCWARVTAQVMDAAPPVSACGPAGHWSGQH